MSKGHGITKNGNVVCGDVQERIVYVETGYVGLDRIQIKNISI
jgi:hypothetical protein